MSDAYAETFDRDRWRDRTRAVRENVPVSSVVKKAVALEELGNSEWKGLCPFHNEGTPSFTVNDKKGFYHCFGCGAHGNVLDFIVNTAGQSFREAVELLESENGLKAWQASAPPPKRPSVKQADDSWREEAVDRIWKQTVEVRRDSFVDAYLRGRRLVPPALYGIGDPAVNAGWPPDIRFHGDLWHKPEGRAFPAMVAAYRNGAGEVVAVHRTYLKRGTGAVAKAGTKRDKSHLGNRKGAYIRLSIDAAKMTGGEGIETSLSAMQLFGRHGFAFGSADAMEAVLLPFVCENFWYAADWNARTRTGEKAAWKGKRLNQVGRRIEIKVPNLRDRDKADFNDLHDRLIEAAGAAERRSGVPA